MNFNQLKYIIAVAQHQSFTNAAHACHVAQSTLSKEIQRLEQEFNVVIFDRSRNPVIPTNLGKNLIIHAQKILDSSKEFTEAAQTTKGIEGTFKLGILQVLAPYLLPTLLHTISKSHDTITIVPTEDNFKTLEQQLHSGALDGFIGFIPFVKSGYYNTLLGNVSFVHYSPTHTQQNAEKAIPLLLHQDLEAPLVKEFPDAFSATSLQLFNGSLETIKQMVHTQGGQTWLPDLVKTTLTPQERTYITAHPYSYQKSVGLITARYFEKETIIKLIKETIQSNWPILD